MKDEDPNRVDRARVLRDFAVALENVMRSNIKNYDEKSKPESKEGAPK